jgi:THO complex subunit 1
MNDIFPMSERSGVNLRGEYGPTWEGPPDPHEGKAIILAETAKEEERKSGVKDEAGDVKMGEGDAVELTPEQKKACKCKALPSSLVSDPT